MSQSKNKQVRENQLRILKNIPKNQLDELFHTEHEAVFKHTDCLTCANCCKTTGPRFTAPDIQRLAKLFRQPVSGFTDQYLRMDEDGDYVLQSVPCPFLLEDNKCFVYDQRPIACREYPHTNRRNMKQILKLTVKNAEICPAVDEILNRITVKKKG